MEAVRISVVGYEFQGLAANRWSRRALNLLKRLYKPLEKAENELLKMHNFSAMAEQLAFLALADRLLLSGPQKLHYLYTLMFYNVFAYSLSYVRELINRNDWSPYVTLTDNSRIRHLAMSATKIVLEWTKAVTFLVTLAFALFCFGQALHSHKSSFFYIAITWSYYMATEKIFADTFSSLLTYMQFEALQSLENLYAPVILRLFTISVSAFFVLVLLPLAPWRFLFITCYLNVFLRWKELARDQWPVLQKEMQILSKYRKATDEEIKGLDDVCAVCLSTMTRARVTPCQHFFHDSCLWQCLKNSDICPLCKQRFIFI